MKILKFKDFLLEEELIKIRFKLYNNYYFTTIENQEREEIFRNTMNKIDKELEFLITYEKLDYETSLTKLIAKYLKITEEQLKKYKPELNPSEYLVKTLIKMVDKKIQKILENNSTISITNYLINKYKSKENLLINIIKILTNI